MLLDHVPLSRMLSDGAKLPPPASRALSYPPERPTFAWALLGLARGFYARSPKSHEVKARSRRSRARSVGASGDSIQTELPHAARPHERDPAARGKRPPSSRRLKVGLEARRSARNDRNRPLRTARRRFVPGTSSAGFLPPKASVRARRCEALPGNRRHGREHPAQRRGQAERRRLTKKDLPCALSKSVVALREYPLFLLGTDPSLLKC